MKALELINIMFPEHDRTSCSDKDLSNAYYLNDDWTMSLNQRCSRCAALKIADTWLAPSDQKIYISSY